MQILLRRRHLLSRFALGAVFFVLSSVKDQRAEADLVLTTNTYADLEDGSVLPGYFDAFYAAGGNPNRRAVAEFDISTLAGTIIQSAVFQDLNLEASHETATLSGFYGNGTIEYADYSNVGTILGYFPQADTPPYTILTIDATSFIQDAINSGQNYVGFVLWQPSFVGEGFEIGSDFDLLITGNTPPLSVPEPRSDIMILVTTAVVILFRFCKQWLA